MRTINVSLPEADLNGDGVVTLDELLRSTGYVVVMVCLLLLAMIGGFALQFTGAPYWLKVIGGTVSFSVVIGAVLGVRRQLRYERAEKWEREERARRHTREDHEFDVLRGTGQREAETRWNQSLQDQYARLWLRLSYERGKPVTRDEWKRQRQPVDAWNRVNALMNKRRIRKGSGLVPETMGEAWGMWCDAEMAARSWVRASDTDFVSQ